ncbi:hypothetical protein R1sor_001342 [Riccia sorocarpa]|uniref:Uncharacterized protein n=1 Tax=Riccia sorocarpa TaxID=122646 RepID=A0ABD3GYZ1_9MARC
MEELQRKVVEVMNSIGSIHMGNVDRGAATQRIVAHMRREFPKHNVMVVHTQHMQSFEECAHSHIELKTGWIGTTGFEIYVFKRGGKLINLVGTDLCIAIASCTSSALRSS